MYHPNTYFKHLICPLVAGLEQLIIHVGQLGMGLEFGLFWDSVSLELSRGRPEASWYTRLLATRDALELAWFTDPRAGSERTHVTIIALSTALGCLDVRHLAVRNGSYLRQARTLALPPPLALLFTRPPIPIQPDSVPLAFSFLRTQVRASTGNLLTTESAVYQFCIGGSHYIGRTFGVRNQSATVHQGLWPIWSEHTRELAHHHAGANGAERRIRRYQVMSSRHTRFALNIICLEICPTTIVSSTEAALIAISSPQANGTEHMHLAEACRPTVTNATLTHPTHPLFHPHLTPRTQPPIPHPGGHALLVQPEDWPGKIS